MKLQTFINRPILAGVISVLILLVGLIGLSNLPMEQYPDIAPPTVMVSTTYTGANAETVQKSVVVPLEEAINGVEDMIYMTSTSTNTGAGDITVYFKQGTDPDMATINTKNRVSEAEGLLPAEVTQIGVTVEKRQNSMLKIIALYSPDDSYDQTFINNYFKINIEPRLSRISGVGNVNVMGDDYAMRIWLNPQKMAQYGLVPADITAVLDEQNIETATGTLGEDSDNTFQYTLKYRGRYEKPEEFGNLVITSLEGGEVLRLKDIATIELGTQSYSHNSEVNGHPGATAMISQTAGSNANEIISEIDKLMEEVNKELPKGLVLADLMSTKEFLDASIHEVVKTLVEAIILVILVVYVFLQSIRSTVIPAISVIVSLVGTFAFLYVAGFSLNLLTLFALVLVIGTVVDDAIVVVEAVQAQFDEGIRSPYQATTRAMDGIATAIVTTSLVFMAVFVPTSFMGGTSGTFYMQFGLTMAVAVGISAINALTLCPALCALIMTPHTDASTGQKLSFSSRFHQAFEASFNRLLLRYKSGVKWFFRRKWLIGAGVAASIVLLAVLMKSTKNRTCARRRHGHCIRQRHHASRKQPFTNHQGHGRSGSQHQRHTANHALLQRSRIQHAGRTGCQRRNAHHQTEELGRTAKGRRLHHCCHRRNIPPYGQYTQCQALRLRTTHHHGIQHRKRRGALCAGPRRRRHLDTEGIYRQVHRGTEQTPRNTDSLFYL